jgi:hypothetical protein
MARLLKAITLVGLTSVTLMQAPCTYTGNGISMIPNVNIFSSLTGALGGLWPF